MTDPCVGYASLSACGSNCPSVCSSWMDRTDKTMAYFFTCGKVAQEIILFPERPHV